MSFTSLSLNESLSRIKVCLDLWMGDLEREVCNLWLGEDSGGEMSWTLSYHLPPRLLMATNTMVSNKPFPSE